VDDPALSAVQAVHRAGDLAIDIWREPDLPAGLSALIAEAQASGIDWITDFEEAWQARPYIDAGEALFLAFDRDRPVAMAVISADPHVASADTGRLRYIYVAAAARGRGLLRVFVELCLSHGAARWRRLRLHTDNPVAARIYESYGFVPAGNEIRSTHVRVL
jgi:GNAT superfamily N-acetyltransferase